MANIHNLGEVIPRDAEPQEIWQIEVGPQGEIRQFTFADLHQKADAVARSLTARGHKRGEAVGILAGNCAEYIQTYFGIMRAGLVAVPINFKFPQKTIDHIIKDADVRFLIVDQERQSMAGNLERVCLDQSDAWQDFLDPGVFVSAEMAENENANILYTSGSSGPPKGVPLTHGGYVWAANILCQSGPPMRGKRMLVAAPLYHMNGLLQSTLMSMAGGAVVLVRQFSAKGYLQAAAEHRCQVVTSIPTMLALAAREAETISQLDFSATELVIMGSAPATDLIADQAAEIFPKAIISNTWGTTESSPVVFGPHPDKLPKPKLSVGHPLPQAELKFIDGVDDNEGTLLVRNRAVMPGYLNRPDETAKRLKDGWYDTGDVMRRDENNFYFFVRRADDMFVCGGENVYPAEVERRLAGHPDIAQVAVVSIPDPIKQQIPVAYVVAKPGTSPSIDEIKQFAIKNGPAYQHPRFVAFIRELPLAGTNKIDTRVLTDRAQSEFSRS